MQSSAPNTPSTKVALNGVFRTGVWYCNCSPRLPAVQFTVRKESPNKGRLFYTCPKDRNQNKCDFFLWSEDARDRELGAALTNSRSEVESPSRAPKRQRTLHESITPAKEKRPWNEKTPVTSLADLDRMLAGTSSSSTAKSPTLKASSSSNKEVAGSRDQLFSSDEDELSRISNADLQPRATQDTPSAGSKRKRPATDEYSDFSSGGEDELVALVESSSQEQAKYHNVFQTPTTSKSHVLENGMPTPLTDKPVRRVLFADPEVSSSSSSRGMLASSASIIPRQVPTASPFSTPPSSQESGKSSTAGNLTQEVMALLEGQKLDSNVLRGVRAVLNRHAARATGLERGRDASRDAIRKAEARVAELARRVADLENLRKSDAEARRKMRTDLMKIYREG
ncbi:hypothetical protein F4677DRAFT_401005 [Hypoxylon crocopeplum]|nr:hypothetical protein F4677DRAFT_401005 [Hypoxylon crocopeplum]